MGLKKKGSNQASMNTGKSRMEGKGVPEKARYPNTKKIELEF